jgi:DNA gyrase inhibitor
MEISVETLPNYRIVFARQVGPYGPSNVQVMEKIKRWAQEKNLLTESSILLGIPQDNPETTSPQDCRFDACLVISNDYQLDSSFSETDFQGGNYMVFKIKHTAEDIQKAWTDIFPILQGSSYKIDNKPIIERYIGDMNQNEYCDICVPIKQL